jgi:uncharacterized protein YndB with AHSA1/START domain
MARDSVLVAAAPQRVFDILSDPFAYSDWVVGTRQILGAYGPWPQPGASLRYDAGVGPLRVRDRTVVVAADPPHRLELMAKARPFPDAVITVEVRPAPGGSAVTLVEHAANPLLRLAMGPLGLAVSVRNRLALRRLKRLVEEPGR